jgi:predicted GNAT family N-acyltransferase
MTTGQVAETNRNAQVVKDTGPIFEPGYKDREGKFTFVKNPSDSELRQIYEMTLRDIGPFVAPFSLVQKVYRHNPASFWAICRSEDETRREPQFAGYSSYLLLNAAGWSALKAGTLDAQSPQFEFLAAKGEKPVALYLWAIVAPRLADLAGALIAHAMGIDFYTSLPLYATISTEAALKGLRRTGRSSITASATVGSFFEIIGSEQDRIGLYAMPVVAGGLRKLDKNLRPQLETVVAATPDHMAKAAAIRAAVFMLEQACPYEEEFDGNDYTGTHIVGFVNGEAAATLRVRYFADFVKFERLAVLPKYRNSTLIAKRVVEHAMAFCQRKGYRKMYGHAQKRFVKLWSRFGFRAVPDMEGLVYSDHEYVVMAGEIPPHNSPLTINSDPMMLIRPEGHWDTPGPLDLSVARPATNPR